MTPEVLVIANEAEWLPEMQPVLLGGRVAAVESEGAAEGLPVKEGLREAELQPDELTDIDSVALTVGHQESVALALGDGVPLTIAEEECEFEGLRDAPLLREGEGLPLSVTSSVAEAMALLLGEVQLVDEGDKKGVLVAALGDREAFALADTDAVPLSLFEALPEPVCDTKRLAVSTGEAVKPSDSEGALDVLANCVEAAVAEGEPDAVEKRLGVSSELREDEREKHGEALEESDVDQLNGLIDGVSECGAVAESNVDAEGLTELLEDGVKASEREAAPVRETEGDALPEKEAKLLLENCEALPLSVGELATETDAEPLFDDEPQFDKTEEGDATAVRV